MKVTTTLILLICCVTQGCVVSKSSEADDAYALLHPDRLPSFCSPSRESACVIHCPGGVTHVVHTLSSLAAHDTYDRKSLCRSLR